MADDNLHVYLGRFSPFHKGHQALLSLLTGKYGAGNCLVIIGSTNTRNERTPYTYEQRAEMIRTLYPDVEVVGLPDGKPNQLVFDGTTNDAWLNSIEDLQKKCDKKFIFYGGSQQDLMVLSQRFPTVALTDRFSTVPVSGTEIRQALVNEDSLLIDKSVDPRILHLVIDGYKEFKKTVYAKK